MRRRQLPGEPPPPTKSELKRRALGVQELADRLIEAPEPVVQGLDLPEKLRDALALARRITSHGALLRQRQYVAKLMRGLDPVPVRAALDAETEAARRQAAQFRRAERWRDRLIAEPGAALAEFLAECPAADRNELSPLVSAAAREHAGGQPAGAGRALFRWLRTRLTEWSVPTDEPQSPVSDLRQTRD
jgi:ribosome-associated protein